MDQRRFTAIHFKDLNHNNAVAKATATAAVSLFNLEIGQFFLSFENFTTIESFTAEYPARKALLSWPRQLLVFYWTNLSLQFIFYVFVHRCMFPHEASLLHATQDTNIILAVYCCLEFRYVLWPSVCGGIISAHEKVTYTFAHVNFWISGSI